MDRAEADLEEAPIEGADLEVAAPAEEASGDPDAVPADLDAVPADGADRRITVGDGDIARRIITDGEEAREDLIMADASAVPFLLSVRLRSVFWRYCFCCERHYTILI